MAKPPKDDIGQELDAIEDSLTSEPDDAPDFNTVLSDEIPFDTSSGMGRGFVFFLFLLASLLGGAIGWIGPKLNASPDPLAELTVKTRTQYNELSAAITKNGDQLKALQSSVDSTKRGVADNSEALRAQSEDLAIMRARIETIENLAPKEDALTTTLDALDKRISALENLKVLGAKTKDGKNIQAGALIARVDALESAAKSTSDSKTIYADEITQMRADIDALQNTIAIEPDLQNPKAETIEQPEVAPPYDRERGLNILIETFPRDKMVEAARAQEKLAAKKPSWLKRVISRHVKTRARSTQDPVILIDSIEKNIRAGDIDTALEQISTLNPPVRAIAADWVKSAKKFQKQDL